jgi:hypothetical protein
VNNSGVIECLRETGSTSPFVHADEISKVEFVTPQLPTGKKFRPKNEDTDPFSDGVNPKKIEPADSDPFGDNKPSKTDSDDPFGGGGSSGGTKKPSAPPAGGKNNDDPFGGGGSGDKKSDDPFGGG